MDVPGHSCWDGGRAGKRPTAAPARLESVGPRHELLYHPGCLRRVVYGLTLPPGSIPGKAAFGFCFGASGMVIIILTPCRCGGRRAISSHPGGFSFRG